jgi:lysophospholipase L1-like esterase
MTDPISFDPHLGWVNITDPNNIPVDARVLTAEDLIRYEKLGIDTTTVVNGHSVRLDGLDVELSTKITDPTTSIGDAVAKSSIAVTAPAVAAQVPPLVTQALAADPAPATAAAAAVGTALTAAGVVSGGYPILANDAVAFSIVGQGGRRSWIEIAQNGSPTPESAALIAKAAAPIIDAQGLLPTPRTMNDGPGIAFVITDSAGRKSWVEVGLDGRPTQGAAAMIDTAMGALTGARIDAKTALLPIPQTIGDATGIAYAVTDSAGRMSEIQIDSSGRFTGPFPARILAAAVTAVASSGLGLPPIACWGDSLTAGGWPATLATELGVITRNFGIGGQGAASIAARQGGSPALITAPSDTIPASGSFTVTSISATPYSSPSGTGTSSGHGTLAGVPGTLTRDNVTNVTTFTRDTAGTAVWCPKNTPWVTDEAVANAAQMAIIWSGRNGFNVLPSATLVAYIQSMVTYMDVPRKRFLVLEIPPFTGEEIGTANRTTLDAVNAALLAAFPNNFVPVAQYLRGPALADGGYTPTTQDTTDIANGMTPSTLRGGDPGHPTAAAHVLIGKYLAKIIQQKGWKLS